MTSLRNLLDRAVAGPDYPPDSGDLADLRVAGLSVPIRASVAILAATAIIVADRLRLFVPPDGGGSGPIAGIDALNVERLILFLVVPLAIIAIGFRDDPARYALKPGDWRWGVALLVAGLVVMTPIVVGLSALPSFRDYYGSAPRPLGTVLASNLIELIPAEFLLRGFLLFALWRRIGPLALVVVQVPFVLTHIGKPDIELWSTFIGGTVFAWLNWRTGSILWSALGHVYVLTVMVVAVGGATL